MIVIKIAQSTIFIYKANMGMCKNCVTNPIATHSVQQSAHTMRQVYNFLGINLGNIFHGRAKGRGKHQHLQSWRSVY
jgi:hypothetical protein